MVECDQNMLLKWQAGNTPSMLYFYKKNHDPFSCAQVVKDNNLLTELHESYVSTLWSIRTKEGCMGENNHFVGTNGVMTDNISKIYIIYIISICQLLLKVYIQLIDQRKGQRKQQI